MNQDTWLALEHLANIVAILSPIALYPVLKWLYKISQAADTILETKDRVKLLETRVDDLEGPRWRRRQAVKSVQSVSR